MPSFSELGLSFNLPSCGEIVSLQQLEDCGTEESAAVQRTCEKLSEDCLHLPIARCLTLGINRNQLTRHFCSLPLSIKVKLNKILQSVQDTVNDRTAHLVNLERLCSSTSTLSNDDLHFDLEGDMWQSQNICGHLKCTYDPSSHELLNVQFNDKLSQHLGLGRDELQRKISDHSLVLPCPELDFFCLMIHETKLSIQSKFVRWVTLCITSCLICR
jgi:hypothetical protein